MSAGDVLMVQDGTYNEQICDSDTDHCPGFTRPPNGTSWSNLTVIKAENVRGATINKASTDGQLELVVNLSQVSTQYVSIEDFVIDGRSAGASCVWIGPANHLQIKGNEIKNCGGNGIYGSVDGSDNNGDDLRIVGNEIHNVSVNQPSEPGTHGIYFTGHYSLIQGNFIYGCPFYGIQASSEHGGLHDNIIENNRVYGCRSAGITQQGSFSIIRNNLLENNCIGIRAGASSSKYYNNTIFDFSNACNSDSYGILITSSGTEVKNNVILQQDFNTVYIYSTAGSPNLEGNLCDGGTSCQINVGDYTTVVVNGVLSASETPTVSNLALKSGSGAINTGSNLGSDVPTDRLGVARPQGAGYDIGAYEFSAGGDVTAPTVSITAPSGGATVSGNAVSVTASASDDVGVVGVQFKRDGVNIGSEDTASPYAVVWDTTVISNGSYVLTAVARDAAGNSTTSSTVTVTVSNGDAVAPTVSVTAPLTAATVSGSVTMSAIASDNVAVVDVQFKVDGGNVGTPDVGPSYDRPWDTTGYSDGSHTVTATARDAAGNSTISAGVSVTVNNGGGGGSSAVVARRRGMFMRY
jgi:hypothetical protein